MEKTATLKKRSFLFYDHFTHSNNYLYVLLSLFGLILFPSFSVLLEDESHWVFRVCYSITVFCSMYIITNRIRDFVIGAILGLATLLLFWGDIAIYQMARSSILSQVVSLAFFWYVGVHLTRGLIHQKEITINVIFGATVGYMLIGVLFGQIYGILESFMPGSFVNVNEHIELSEYGFTYFSFITLTTVGYGDVVPFTDPARSVTIIAALCGQMYMTVLIAILIGKFLSQGK